jgi:hypothetical protein
MTGRATAARRGLLAAVVIAAAVTAVGRASAQDTEKPAVVFDETAPLALSWEDLDKGVSVEVFNNSPDPMTLSFSVTALRGDGSRHAASKYLAVESAEPPATPTRGPAVLELGPGKSEAIVITRVGGATLPSGSYRSLLVAYDAKRKPIARLPLAITVVAAAAEAKAEPLTDTLTITVYRNRYLLGWLDDRLDTTWFSDRYPAPDDALLPLKTKAETVSLPTSVDERLLGGIQGPNGAVAVSYAATLATLESGRRALDLEFDGLKRFGEYQGDLDTLPADKDAGKVTLKLVSSDFIWWPLLAVSLGVLTGFLISRLIGVGLPSRRLRDEVALLREDYAYALTSFAGGKKRPRGWRAANITKPVNDALEKCEDDIRGFGRTQIANIPPDDVKELRQKVADVRTCVNAFTAYAGDMEDLEKKIDELKTKRPRPLPVLNGGAAPPHAATELSKLLVGTSFDSFDAFKAHRDAVTKALANASVWQKREKDISEAQADIETVKGPNAALLDLADDLLGFYRGLWNHTDVTEAANEDYGDALRELRGKIDDAVSEVPKRERRRRARTRPNGRPTVDADRGRVSYGPSGAEPTGAGAPSLGAGGALLGTLLAVAGGVLRAAWNGVTGGLRWLIEADQHLSNWIWTRIKSLSEWIWSRIDGFVDKHLGGWWTLGLLLVAFAVAIFTGLSTEYAGKAFGTSLWDYVKLFLWGVATKLVLDGVVKGLDAIGVPRLLRR